MGKMKIKYRKVKKIKELEKNRERQVTIASINIVPLRSDTIKT